MGPPIPDDPDQPPGPRNLVRIFAETLQAHVEALSTGEDLSARLTPRNWFGSARETFVDTGLPKIDTEWQQIVAINRGAAERVNGHSRFLHSLRDLWPFYSNDPAERARLRALEEQGAGKLADELLAMAAELDQLGHVNLADPAISAVPDNPAPRAVDPAPAAPGPEQLDREHTAAHSAQTPQNGWHQAEAMFRRSYHTAVRLREQILAGERRDHIPWTG